VREERVDEVEGVFETGVGSNLEPEATSGTGGGRLGVVGSEMEGEAVAVRLKLNFGFEEDFDFFSSSFVVTFLSSYSD